MRGCSVHAASETFVRWVMGERGGGSTSDCPEYPEERRQALLGNAPETLKDIDSGDGSHLSREQNRAIKCLVTQCGATCRNRGSCEPLRGSPNCCPLPACGSSRGLRRERGHRSGTGIGIPRGD